MKLDGATCVCCHRDHLAPADYISNATVSINALPKRNSIRLRLGRCRGFAKALRSRVKGQFGSNDVHHVPRPQSQNNFSFSSIMIKRIRIQSKSSGRAA